MNSIAAALAAHRGWSSHYPENSFTAIKHAVESGVKFVEIDIQFLKDCTPVLFHDSDLSRAVGIDHSVFDLSLEEFRSLTLPYKEKFGSDFYWNGGMTLSEAVDYFKDHKDVHLFIEVKEESVKHFGYESIMSSLAEIVYGEINNFSFVSYDEQFLREVKDLMGDEIQLGYIPYEMSTRTENFAKSLNPQWVFYDVEFYKDSNYSQWQGPWRNVAYTSDSLWDIARLVKSGFDVVETDDCGSILTRLNGKLLGDEVTV